MGDLSDIVRNLSPEKRALLALRLKENGSQFNTFPLSFAQRRLWFLDRLEPGSPLYNIPMAFRLHGALSVNIVQRAIHEIVRRHETLRTTFSLVGEEPMQIVHRPQGAPLKSISLRHVNVDAREGEAERIVAEEARTPFDLERGPLFRVSLVELGDEDHILLFTTHHAISDGWSMGVLIDEFTLLYSSFARGEASPLLELPIQYADFASWQRDWMAGPVMEKQRAYWRERLGDAPPVLDLPTDRPRPPLLGPGGSSVSKVFSRKLVQDLKGLAGREESTLFMVLLAGIQTLLSRYSGQEDISVGTPIANRTRPETERLIGFFANTLVLRTSFEGDPSFRALIRRVREIALGAYSNQDLPFEKLVEDLNPVRDTSHTPLFQVMFALQNAPAHQERGLGGLRISQLKAHSGTSTFDLSILAGETTEGLSVTAEFNTDLFDATTIDRLLEHLEVLLGNAVNDPDERASRLEIMAAKERRDVLQAFAAAAVPIPLDRPLHRLFEERVDLSPEAVAVLAGDASLTYRELNARANELARFLRRQGVGREVLVGVSLERSPELLIGLLGILKAGGAYVPLDPEYPPERIAAMVSDANIQILLTQEKFRERFERSVRQVFTFETEGEEIRREASLDLEGPVFPGQAMYVIYTSGSTGQPKGVVVTHRSVVNHNLAVVREFGLTEKDRVLQFASINFDAAVEEIFPTWLAGGTLVLRDAERSISIHDLHKMIERYGLTVLDIPTGFWHEWVRAIVAEGLRVPPTVRLVVIGGEKVLAERLTEWELLAVPKPRLLNTYGPTETTVISTAQEFGRGEIRGGETPYPGIGSPIANTSAYVVDRNFRPVPAGVYGELVIGGEGLARGYLRCPERTAERFVPDPFSADGGSRLYRTGDRVRLRKDGNLEFGGRIDQQVKIRGFRVEPGEVEAVIAQCPGIRDVVVIVRERSGAGLQLVACCVADGSASGIGEAEVREWAERSLPSYMIPSAFVFVSEIPRTPSGKIDRKALASDLPAGPEMSMEFAAPRTATEEVLAGIWADLLGIDRVGSNHNFFDLGGHSLLATQVASRVRISLGVEIPLRVVFEAPTVASLARAIDSMRLEASGLGEGTIPLVSRDEPLPLSFAQQRLWFLDQLEPGAAIYNVPEAFRVRGPFDVEAFGRSVRFITARHEILRASFPTIDGRAQMLIRPEVEIEIPVQDLSNLTDPERELAARRILEEEAKRPFVLSHGPLIRVMLLKLGEQDQIVLLVMHHIICDAWSTSVLIRELAECYRSFVTGLEPGLRPLSVQYPDYSVWQRKWLEGPRLDQQLQYWKNKLDGSPQLLSLPTDMPRSGVQTSRGAHFTFTLPENISAALRVLSRKEGATLFMAMMAALQTLMYRMTGQTDVPIGTPIANRTRREIEHLVGFFVNTLVIRTTLEGGMSFREIVRRVRENTLEAYANQDLPFEKVVDAVAPERNTSRTPLFQMMLLVHPAPPEAVILPGVTMTQVPVETGVTPFDITLALQDLPGGMGGGIEYNADLYLPATIERFARLFGRLLEAAAERPDTPVASLPILSDEERETVISRWNATEAEFPRERCLHELVEEQVGRTPDAIAVKSADVTITYRELNGRANQVARRLRSLGVGQESIVGISIERSVEMAVGLLGILKAGGAYLPLDPKYPHERIAFMCRDAGVSLLVTMSQTASELNLDGVRTLCLDGDGPVLRSESTDNLPCIAGPGSLAYVIYTSGSTGRPKGVEVSHRSVVNHNTAAIRLFGLQRADRVLQFATLNFDAAIEEIFPTWLSGGTLVLRPGAMLPSADGFVELIEREGITVVDIPTAFWSEWTYALSMSEKKIPSGLRLVIVGGDAVQPARLALWQLLAPGSTRWLNTYGPTEGTIIATSWDPGPGRRDALHTVPIGRPISNVSIYLLDQNFQPVPPGVPGELWIGGEGVARGYRGRADLTAERFMPDPFTPTAGRRMYRTGDLARYTEAGDLEFLGRTDHQVKIRGFRIELSEIESTLLRHPGLREVVVDAKDYGTGEKRLAAFYVSSGDVQLPPEKVKEYCQGILPDYMVPSIFVPLRSIPRTISGKVNRELLTVPDDPGRGGAVEEDGQLSAAEAVLAEIWKQVLGLKKVGTHDNFFELGGDSIVSIQVVARATKGGLRITPAMLFQYPTIAQLAGAAESIGTGGAEEGPVTGPVPLSPIQKWFFAQKHADQHQWNQSLMLEVHHPLDPGRLKEAVGVIIRHHDALRMRFENLEGEWRQTCVEPGDEIPFQLVDMKSVQPDLLRSALEESASEFQRSLDLTRGPLMRVVYYDCGAERPGRILLIVHHLVIDGVSWRLVLEDLQAVYQQLTLGDALWLPPKTTSIRNWVKGLMEFSNSDAAALESEQWAAMLPYPPAPIPRDLPGNGNSEESARSVSVSLTSEETASLLHDVPRAYGTEINDVLVAALAGAFARWTGSSQLFLEMEGHGREEIVPGVNVSRTVGWFTSVFPVLIDLRSVSGDGAILKSVKEQLRKIPQKGAGFLPLRMLSEQKEIRQRLHALPVPDVSFNYLGQMDATIAETTTFRPARESPGRERSGKAKRSHLIDINGAIAGGRLHVEWTYSIYYHRQETMETLASDFLSGLRLLIQHCKSPEAGGYTPSDFGLAKLDQRKLDKVLQNLGKSRNKGAS